MDFHESRPIPQLAESSQKTHIISVPAYSLIFLCFFFLLQTSLDMQPKAWRKPRPDCSSKRLEIYLTTKCFICLDTPNIHSSRPRLPCCGQNIHEDCLLGCLRFANQAVQDTCPHCRAILTPYHISDVNIPLGPNLFCFQWVTYPPPPPPPPQRVA